MRVNTNTYKECETVEDQEYATHSGSKAIVAEVMILPNSHRKMLIDYETLDQKMVFTNTDSVARSMEMIEHAIRLDRENRTDSALDVICEHFDGMIFRGGFKRVSQLLDSIRVESLSVPLILALLTITAPLAEKIESRSGFFERCKKALDERGERREELLEGLE
jgi:hypothetical protein